MSNGVVVDLEDKIKKYLDHSMLDYYDLKVTNPTNNHIEIVFSVESVKFDYLTFICEKIGRFIETEGGEVNICQIGGR